MAGFAWAVGHLGLTCVVGYFAAVVALREVQWEAAEWTGWADFAPPSVAAFAGLWFFEHLALCVLNLFGSLVESIATNTQLKRTTLARHCMDTAALYGIAAIGVDMALKFDFSTQIPATPQERLFIRMPEFEFLCVFMLAFQMKNLVDSFIWRDPAVYIVHHVVCVFVAFGTLDGHFLHLYGIFFFGVSEVSTAVLSGLAAFDPDHGVVELSELFPLTKLITGGVFITLFVSIRLVAWPYLAYKLALDAQIVIAEGTHTNHVGIVWAFLGCLAGLTVLQFVWLIEIFARIKEELFTKKPKSS